MTHYARTTDKGPSDWQILPVHLHGVAALAECLARKALPNDTGLAEAARVAGLLHDLGKYNSDWQAGLLARRPRLPPHSIHGAAFALGGFEHLPIAVAVAGHHAGLHDAGHLASILTDHWRDHGALVSAMVRQATHDILDWPDRPPVWEQPLPDDHDSLRRLEYWCRFLFSVLVDADRLDSERFVTGRERSSVALEPARLLERIDAARAERARGREAELIVALRNRAFARCMASGAEADQGFFELTLPTGGGKTYAAMAFALAHARRHGLRRVFVVVPYTSIIEQNAREYRSVLGSDQVVEHHSAAEYGANARTGERPERAPEELANENWDAPVVVTTNVQFLETLLAASPRRCRRLHNVARSVVIFDEAQALPSHLLNPLLAVFRHLVDGYGVSIVLSTATQPAFRQGYGLSQGLRPGELRPIMPEPLRNEMFSSLRRVRYRIEIDKPKDWPELADEMLSDKRALCVLNTRRHAAKLWRELQLKVRERFGETMASAVRHLSSAMCPQHRLDCLGRSERPREGTVRHSLMNGRPCWLVSTQVVEAGVDLDFPRALRALGPLDSIVQVAGRCNREGRQRFGEVLVFQPTEAGGPQGVYETATVLAAETLGEATEEDLAVNSALFADYFQRLYARCDTDRSDDRPPIHEDRAALNYRSVAERARVIQDDNRSVVVPYGQADRLVRAIRRHRSYDHATRRRLQRFVVGVRDREFQTLRDQGRVEPLLGEDGPWVLLGGYDPDLGLLVDDTPAAESWIG